MAKKYYWLRLQRDFFKRHDIRIIESMPNGKDYILFYLKLLVESIDHEGELRFSETIPYNEDMLATVTETNIDIVRSAMKIFTELQMIEVMDDQTIFMAEVEKMIGSASMDDHARESARIRKQNQRARQKLECDSHATCHGEIEKEIEKESEIEKETKKRVAPVYFVDDSRLDKAFKDYVDMRKKIKSPMTERAIELAITNLQKLSGGDNDIAIQILDQSVMNSWKGLFPVKENKIEPKTTSIMDKWANL